MQLKKEKQTRFKPKKKTTVTIHVRNKLQTKESLKPGTPLRNGIQNTKNIVGKIQNGRRLRHR